MSEGEKQKLLENIQLLLISFGNKRLERILKNLVRAIEIDELRKLGWTYRKIGMKYNKTKQWASLADKQILRIDLDHCSICSRRVPSPILKIEKVIKGNKVYCKDCFEKFDKLP